MITASREEEVQLLSEITLSINQGNSLEEVFDLIYNKLSRLVPYNRIAIALTDEAREKLYIIAARSDGKMVLSKGYTGRIAGSSLEPLIREGRTRVINDLQEYLAAKPASESTRLIVKEGMRSSLTLPLLVQGNPIGVMFFSSREANAYTPEHEAILRNIVGHVAVAVERSRLLDTLRERTEYLDCILTGSADAVIVEGVDGRVRTWNEGARLMYGYAAEEAIGQPLEMLVPHELLVSGELETLRTRTRDQGVVKDYETTRVTRDGRRITVNQTSTLLKNRQGKVIGRSILQRDVTHVKRLQQDLLTSRSLAAVGELAATVAHEIKNPLAGISGAIQVIAEGMLKSDPRREIVGEVLEQIKRLDSTVRDLLTYSRPATPSRQDIDVRASLTRAWSILSQQPGANQVWFNLEGPDEVVHSLDAPLLHQVWLNLLQNALEAMPRGGKLTVRITDGPAVRIAIQDTGTGMDAAALERVFRPFYTTKTRGTGLGLAISKKIIEAHGGRIWAESQPNRGTSFFVEIPR